MEQDSIPMAMKGLGQGLGPGLGQRTSTELSTDMQLVNMSLSSLCLAEAKGGGGDDHDHTHPSASSSMNYFGKSGVNVGAKSSSVGAMAKMISTSSSTGRMMMDDDDDDDDNDLLMNDDDDEDDDEGGEFEEDEVGVGDGDESLERDVTLQRGSNVPLGDPPDVDLLLYTPSSDYPSLQATTITSWSCPPPF